MISDCPAKNTTRCGLDGCIRCTAKNYQSLESRQKLKRDRALQEAANLLQMSHVEAANTFLEFIPESDFRYQVTEFESPLKSVLNSLGASLPLSANHAAALLLGRQYVEGDVKFIQSCFGGIAPLKSIREAKWSFSKDMPELMILKTGTAEWKTMPPARTSVSSGIGRTVRCARFSFKAVRVMQVKGLQSTGRWPTTPYLRVTPEEKLFKNGCFSSFH